MFVVSPRAAVINGNIRGILTPKGDTGMKRCIALAMALILIYTALPAAKAAEEEKKALNILLIGTDERSNKFSTNARSDCMILVSIDREKHTVKLVSFERGMGVPVLEGEHKGQWDWLTHIFRYGGAKLLMKTLEECFEVEIDHYVRVNFQTVTNAVDAIGGIDLELTAAEADYFGRDSAGMHHLNGEETLEFARLRQIDSDWRRIERQRRVIIAVAEGLKSVGLKELKELAQHVLPLIQTNLSALEIGALVLYAPQFMKSEFSQLTIPQEGTYGLKTGMGGRSYFAADFEENGEILRKFLYGE